MTMSSGRIARVILGIVFLGLLWLARAQSGYRRAESSADARTTMARHGFYPGVSQAAEIGSFMAPALDLAGTHHAGGRVDGRVRIVVDFDATAGRIFV
jgi:hypothetical protein